MKKIAKLVVVEILVLSIGINGFQLNSAYASENESTPPQNIKLVGTYSKSQVDSNTMTQLKSIEKEDSEFHVIQNGNTVVIEDILPNPKGQNSNGNRENNTEVVNFSEFIGNMDGEVTSQNSDSNRAYKGQKDGQKVKKGTHVHCNRFNGTKSDHRYWSKKHPKAYVDFYKSDCWYHAKAYKCSSLGKMTKCDGLNVKKKGVKDCSSWKGKPKHKNWPKTAWYRN
ncbi:hypothetical protein ACSBRB_08085 [Staphylococcus auricularis]|uniref:hypothetical protein n=1 Tax=Staphylococcus auricularis TaxID=29379 RepID=UPI003EB80514